MLRRYDCVLGEYDPLSDVLSHELDGGRERRKAEEWATAAEEHAKAAAQSEKAAGISAEVAARSAAAADEVEKAAGDRADEAGGWAKAAMSWAVGGTDTRKGEDTDNAEYWAGQARDSAGTANAGAKVVMENREALQSVLDNLAAIQGAAQNAGRAEAAAERTAENADHTAKDADRAAAAAKATHDSETASAASAAKAEAAARNAQAIAQGQKGYYATADALRAAVPEGEDGDWAIVGTTDTVWIWDSDDGAWKDSSQHIDWSQYYTKSEVDTRLEAKPDKPVDGSFVAVCPNAGSHNAVYRGKSIQGRFDDGSLYTAISKGTFDDLYIGDYFDITISTSFTASEKVRCLLAGFDVFWNCGNAALQKHHAVIVPMNCFAAAANMNDANETAGSYVGSAMYTTTLPEYAAALKAVFDTHLIKSREWTGNVMTSTTPSMAGLGRSGATTACSFIDCELRLMSEAEVYGSTVFSSSAWDVGSAVSRLPLFALAPSCIVCGLGGANYAGTVSRSYWWLSAVSSASDFANVSAYGFANSNGASYTLGVRPRWLIG